MTEGIKQGLSLDCNGKEWIFRNLIHPEQTVLIRGHNKFFVNAQKRKAERERLNNLNLTESYKDFVRELSENGERRKEKQAAKEL